MAERMRFELTVGFDPYDDLANRCLQPLGHLSVAEIYGAGDLILFAPLSQYVCGGQF